MMRSAVTRAQSDVPNSFGTERMLTEIMSFVGIHNVTCWIFYKEGWADIFSVASPNKITGSGFGARRILLVGEIMSVRYIHNCDVLECFPWVFFFAELVLYSNKKIK